jgi:Mg2+ and Co2+ transporter CorA
MENIDEIEAVIFNKTTPEAALHISLLRRDLISFRRVIRPQIAIIEMLERGTSLLKGRTGSLFR